MTVYNSRMNIYLHLKHMLIFNHERYTSGTHQSMYVGHINHILHDDIFGEIVGDISVT